MAPKRKISSTDTHKALQFEELRKKLLAEKKYKEVLRTYRAQNVSLPDENTGEFWDDIFATRPETFPMESWRINKIVSLLDCDKSILNLGVGRGDLEEVLLKKCGQPKYLGTDITPKTIAKLKENFPKLKFQLTDLFGLNPEKYQFSQILLLEVLEHIKPKETLKVLTQVYKLTKPGGYFYLSVPVNEGLEKMLPVNPNSHMRIYSEELVKFEVESVGFSVVEVYRASAFSKYFQLKQLVNAVLQYWQPNNLILVCRKY